MHCWHCERPAHGNCKFCGRAICREHVSTLPHIVDIYASKDGAPKAVVVADALFCGVCKPRGEPIELSELT